MLENRFKVRYSLDGFDIKLIKIDRSYTVLDFLEDIRERFDTYELEEVYLNGLRLDEDELMVNYIEDLNNDIFTFSKDLIKSGIELQKSLLLLDSSDDEDQNDKCEFKVYTTSSIKSFLVGTTVTFNIIDNYEKVYSKIEKIVKDLNYTPKEFDLQIFVNGGIPFLPSKETIQTFYDNNNKKRNKLFVIVTRKLGDFIYEEVPEPCNLNKYNKFALSPVFESTTEGLTQIASFLGYLYHGGAYRKHLIEIFAKCTRFDPLITSIARLIQHEKLNVLNIISITGPLSVFFKSIIRETDFKNVFEYSLRILSTIGLIEQTEELNIKTIDLNNDDIKDENLMSYLKSTNQQDRIVTWVFDEKFKGFNLEFDSFSILDTDNELFDLVTSYKPVSPLSLEYFSHPAFVKGLKEGEVFLFINKDNDGMVNYIDPKVGTIEKASLIDLSKKYNNDQKESFVSVVDPLTIDQIVVLCIDESLAMNLNTKGEELKENETCSRKNLAKEFLRNFVEKSLDHNFSSLYGLIGYSNDAHVYKKIDQIDSHFIDGLNENNTNSSSLLYDAIYEASRLIYSLNLYKDQHDVDDDEEYFKNQDEGVFKNAKLRIIVITDGIDNKSNTSMADLAKILINCKTIVDTVLLSDTNNEICALSNLTGGRCFRVNDAKDVSNLFERNNLIDLKERPPIEPFEGNIDQSVIQREIEKFNGNENTQK